MNTIYFDQMLQYARMALSQYDRTSTSSTWTSTSASPSDIAGLARVMSTRTQIMVHLACYAVVCLLVALWGVLQ